MSEALALPTYSPPSLLKELLARTQARESLTRFIDYRQAGIVPAVHHALLIQHLEAVERGGIERLMVCMPPGSAKALALDTPVPTPTGWATMEELAVGDWVFDERGEPCRVTWKSPVWPAREVYAVQTDCGDTIIADKEHEWLVRACGKREVYKLKETQALCRKRSKRVMVQRAKVIQTAEGPLPLDPYLLGLWLGDGTSSGMEITAAPADEVFYRGELEQRGIKTANRIARYRFGVRGERAKAVRLGLLRDPTHLTYGEKHIPPAYLRASPSQRLALLRGLIDSDGTVCKRRGCTTFTNTNRRLAEEVRELVRTLGVKAGWSEGRAKLYDKDCGPVYRVSFYLSGSAKLPRKAQLTRDQRRTPNTYLTVTPAGFADTVCIGVDSPSHLFLAGRSMTPTHNSTYSSLEFPAWYLGRNPKNNIIAASHTQELAERFGRRVRNIVASEPFRAVFGVGLAPDSKAAGRWDTDQGGEYFAAGVGGSITGRRVDLGLIDDPVRSREDADSERSRNNTWDWYRNDWLTRLKPGARQVIVMTRWHEDDLGGRILEREGHRWTQLILPMEAMPDDPLGRRVGERLWPDWFTDDMVATAKLDVRGWNALYQQQPASEDGEYFKADWFREYEVPPPALRVYGASDYAVTEGGGDYTEHGVFGVDGNDNIYVLDWWRGQASADIWVERKCDMILKHGPLCWFGEAGPIRRAVEPFLMRRMQERAAFCRIEFLPSIADKPTRARAIQARTSMGKVFFPKSADWRADVQGQLLRFPAGKHDDAVDVMSLIGQGLSFIGRPRKKSLDLSSEPVHWMAR